MIALLSKTYMESVYCQTELAYAIKLNKPVLALMLEPDVPYPDILADKNVQYVNVFEWELNQVVRIVLEALHRVETDYHDTTYHQDFSHRPYLRPIVPTPPTHKASEEDRDIAEKVHNAQAKPTPQVEVSEAIIRATYLLDDDAYQPVIDLLEPIRQHAKEQDQVIIQEMLREARLGQEYAKIAALVASKRMKSSGCSRYRWFREIYPDYPDEKKLRVSCPTSIDILPAPFDWIEIPGGRGTMKTDESSVTLTIPTENYWISKYPITNAQFAQFVEAGGYNQPKWWTEGWKQQQSDKWTEPRYWQDANFNGAEQPVVGVSWYEAVAFCLWLTDVTGEKIMLPTEDQWQYAAQGDDGRAYPWEDAWDATRCNSPESGIGKTTPVTQFEGKHRGDSPFGVVDMAGNVWEWCLTDHNNKKNYININTTNRVLRGGSWGYINAVEFRCDSRLFYSPHVRYGYVGFRVSRS